MNTPDSQISIFLQFRAMSAPIAVTVPQHILKYLECHAERACMPDGRMMYRQSEIMPGTADYVRSHWAGWDK